VSGYLRDVFKTFVQISNSHFKFLSNLNPLKAHLK